MMNFTPDLSPPLAIFMSLCAASMWGSWFITLKYLRAYPLDGFIVTLFFTSLVFVWAVSVVLDGSALWGNLYAVLMTDPIRIVVTLIGGVMYMTGMRFMLTVQRSLGLSLTQPLQSSINIFVGMLITMVVGGVPANASTWRIVLASVLLLLAVLVSLLAGYFRTQAQQQTTTQAATDLPHTFSAHELWRGLGLVLVGSALAPGYPFALSFGLRSATQPHGLAVLPFMALLATGAFIGALLTSGVSLTRHGQWAQVRAAALSKHSLGIGAGLFHYGGNIIHTFATGQLSSAVSWPLGLTSGLWTQLWGLVYGEFRGAPRRAYLALFAGVGLYLLGAWLIASMLY